MKSPSTKDFVDVVDIRGNVVLLKDGSLRSVVEVRSINFELKSNDEQVGVIRGFQDFLNSIDFPLQIVVNSRRLDIQPYLTELEQLQTNISSELLKVQLDEYARFIKTLSELAHIMKKRFFLVVPYYAIEAPALAARGFKDRIKGLLSTSPGASTLSDELLERYKAYLEQRVNVVLAGLSPLGIQGNVLEEEALTELYRNYYGNQ